MKTINNKFNDWKEFIAHLLTHNKQFALLISYTKGHTYIEEYQQLQFNKETLIQVGYLNNDTLIYITVTNPNTPGLNKHNSSMYFDENFFDDNTSEGEPGLPFTQKNVTDILEMFSKRLDGKEILFYEDSVLSHSKIYIKDDSGEIIYNFTCQWKKKSFTQKILSIFSKSKSQYTEKEINFSDIFGGIILEKF